MKQLQMCKFSNAQIKISSSNLTAKGHEALKNSKVNSLVLLGGSTTAQEKLKRKKKVKKTKKK